AFRPSCDVARADPSAATAGKASPIARRMVSNGANVNDFLPGRDIARDRAPNRKWTLGYLSSSRPKEVLMRRMVLSVCFVVAAGAVYIGALYIGIGRPVEVLAQTTDTVLYEGARVIVGDGSAAIENAAILVENGKFTTIGRRGQVQDAHAAGRDTRMEEDLSDSTVWLWTKTQVEIYVQEQAYKHVDFIKMWVDDRLGTELHLSPDIYRPLIERAHQHNIPVFAHM